MKKTEEILQIYENYKQNKELVERFLNSEVRYAFGMSSYTLEIAKKLRIDYVTDSKAQNGDGDYHGIPIIALDDIPKGAAILCISLTHSDFLVAILKNSGFEQVIALHELFYYDEHYNIGLASASICWWHPRLVKLASVFAEDFMKHTDIYENIYNELSDDISKRTFEDVILHGLTIAPKFMKNCPNYPDDQYFEDFLDFKEDGEVFIDCGGYDGKTSEMFIKKCPKYAYIYIFEPSEEIENAKKLLSVHQNIEFIKKGVWDKTDTLKFIENDQGSSITTEVNSDKAMTLNCTDYTADDVEIIIETVALDEVISQKVTFIKMDVEGAEINALKGAENIIKRDKPRLAVCVYHRFDDWRQIFDYVKSIRPDYKVYLRHYSQLFHETVMFFI